MWSKREKVPQEGADGKCVTYPPQPWNKDMAPAERLLHCRLQWGHNGPHQATEKTGLRRTWVWDERACHAYDAYKGAQQQPIHYTSTIGPARVSHESWSPVIDTSVNDLLLQIQDCQEAIKRSQMSNADYIALLEKKLEEARAQIAQPEPECECERERPKVDLVKHDLRLHRPMTQDEADDEGFGYVMRRNLAVELCYASSHNAVDPVERWQCQWCQMADKRMRVSA